MFSKMGIYQFISFSQILFSKCVFVIVCNTHTYAGLCLSSLWWRWRRACVRPSVIYCRFESSPEPRSILLPATFLCVGKKQQVWNLQLIWSKREHLLRERKIYCGKPGVSCNTHLSFMVRCADNDVWFSIMFQWKVRGKKQRACPDPPL